MYVTLCDLDARLFFPNLRVDENGRVWLCVLGKSNLSVSFTHDEAVLLRDALLKLLPLEAKEEKP